MKEYLVIRIANKPDGSLAAPAQAFETETEAWKEFYRLCGIAVDSVNISDSVSILTRQGFEIDHKCFEH